MPTTDTASKTAAPTPRATLALANVQYEKKGSIAYVTVDRPKVLNALNTPTWIDLQAAFEDAKADASVHGRSLMLRAAQSLVAQVRDTMLITVFIGIEGASVYSRYATSRSDVGAATILGFTGVTGLIPVGSCGHLGGIGLSSMCVTASPPSAVVVNSPQARVQAGASKRQSSVAALSS